MTMIDKSEQGSLMERTSSAVAHAIGTSRGFLIGVAIVSAMFVFGVESKFDIHWHMQLHTVITIITFVLLFITARVEQKEMTAVQLKLNELLATKEGASNRLINSENAPEKQLKEARDAYDAVAEHPHKHAATSLDNSDSGDSKLDKAS
jgi:low affinity Fe/Cu permease